MLKGAMSRYLLKRVLPLIEFQKEWFSFVFEDYIKALKV